MEMCETVAATPARGVECERWGDETHSLGPGGLAVDGTGRGSDVRVGAVGRCGRGSKARVLLPAGLCTLLDVFLDDFVRLGMADIVTSGLSGALVDRDETAVSTVSLMGGGVGSSAGHAQEGQEREENGEVDSDHFRYAVSVVV